MSTNWNSERVWPRPTATPKPTSPVGRSTTNHFLGTFRQAITKFENAHKIRFKSKHIDGSIIYNFALDFAKLLLWCLSRRDAGHPDCQVCIANPGHPVNGKTACSEHGLSTLNHALGNNGKIVAITYFSWEPREHIFQVRRTFPNTVALFSYSVCYPEWGAVGEMLDALHTMSRTRFPMQLFNIWDPEYLHRALPYLTEPTNHNFDHILAIPVFRPNAAGYNKWKRREIAWFGNELLGLFLTFIRGPSDGSAKDAVEYLNQVVACDEFCSSMEHFTRAVANVIIAQEIAFAARPKRSLAAQWRRLSREGQVQIFRLTIEVRRGADALPLSAASTVPLSSLAAFLIHALRARWCIIRDHNRNIYREPFLAAPSKDLLQECAKDPHHILRCLNSDLDRGLRSIGIMVNASYHEVLKGFRITVKPQPLYPKSAADLRLAASMRISPPS